jgi:hypothetical protein
LPHGKHILNFKFQIFQVLFAFIFFQLCHSLGGGFIHNLDIKKNIYSKKGLIDLFVGKQHNEVVVEGTCSFANKTIQ